MHIPERLEAKLGEDRSLRSSVDAALSEFGPWLAESKLPFFPDYTNHGAEHVEGVLVTASSLIGDEAWDCVTAADACVLILAALLHDCAMHLTEDGFAALVSGRTHTKRVEGFGDADWPALWQEFLFSAKRFDDRALADLFGQPVAVRTPPTDKGLMTLNDRLLVGEFVRRHHPRLAHEIAVRGVPGPGDHPVRLSAQLDEKLADLAGLVARSHGLPLRTTFEYLNARYHRREYKGVHAVFLMAVLRVADYMQIQAERAPKQMLQVKDIRSPLSRQEWRAHHAVDNIVPYEDDPEAILVQATPKDVRTYLRLKGWLGGIQEELDTSWAVLGEVYGPAAKLRRLGLVIRRVRSNLDDERSFARLVDYVPRRVEFDIARSEILKLLIRPLYGDKPEVGIRELLQNSVDAVRELWDLQEQNPSLRDADLIAQEADVVMWLDEPDETGRATFTITDRGVGMTEEVITDYFLKVGASYRHSDAWAKQHERPDGETDDTPGDSAPQLKSRVLRSGRFGIGALAAFLLGEEIEVSTRHVTADKGIRFITPLDSEAIELRYDDALKVGTTIRIPISRSVFDSLSTDSYRGDWDWYCLDRPSVSRFVGKGRKRLGQKIRIPDATGELPPGWFSIDHLNYQAVHFTYNYVSRVVYNGIQIKDINPFQVNIWGMGMGYNYPFVSVFDPDGALPLNLTRTKLEGDNDFVKTVSDARHKLFLAYLLLNAPTSEYDFPEPAPWIVEQIPSGSEAKLWPWFYTKHGISVAEPWNVQQSGVRSCLVLPMLGAAKPECPVRPDTHDAVFLLNLADLSDRYLLELIEMALFGFRERNLHALNDLPQTGTRLITSAERGQDIFNRIKVFGWGRQFKVREEWSDGELVSLITGNPPPSLIDRGDLTRLGLHTAPGSFTPLVAEWFLDNVQPYDAEYMNYRRRGPLSSDVAREWEELLRQPVIPYDLVERRWKLAPAYEALAPYIEKMEGDANAVAATEKGKAPTAKKKPQARRGRGKKR